MKDTATLVENYHPDLPASHWATMEHVVRDTARAYASTRNNEAARNALISLAGFFDWVHTTGIAGVRRDSLRSDLIFAYESYRRTEVSGRVAAQERNLLRTVAGLPRTRANTTIASTTPVSPHPVYSDAELTQFRDWATWQPTANLHVAAAGFAGLALGCGLRPAEILPITASHVHDSDGVLEVKVPGAHARRVRVAPEWTASLRFAAESSDGYLISPKATTRTPLKLLHILRRTRGDHPRPMRSRNTWLLARINEGHSPDELIAMAGLTNVRSLARIIRTHVPHRKDLLRVCDPAS